MGFQAKLAAALIFLAAILGTYVYGHSAGVEAQKGKQAILDNGRISATTMVAIDHTNDVVYGVRHDNEIERKANERYEAALGKLRKERDAYRAAIAGNGGLRINASACTQRDYPAGETKTAGTRFGNVATPGTIALPREIDEGLQGIVDEADELLERLRVLQDWVIEQGFYGPLVPEDKHNSLIRDPDP